MKMNQTSKKRKIARKTKKSLLGKRKKTESDEEDVAKDFFGNDVIEEVPVNDPGAREKENK